MAIYHLSVKPISRKNGRTSIASSAYRASAKITDLQTGETHDYTKKKGVVCSDCFIYCNDEKKQIDREQLWNTAEKAEKRKDSRTAREIIVNLPFELNKEQRKNLIDDFTKHLSKDFNCAIDYAIHEPSRHGDKRNHHAHILMTTRKATLENGKIILGEKTTLEFENKKLKSLDLPKTQDQIKNIRQQWADITNEHLKKAGIDETIDHRSYKDRGLDIEPTIKLGVKVTAIERKGVKTLKGDINRAIKEKNKELLKYNFLTKSQQESDKPSLDEPKLSFLEKRKMIREQEQQAQKQTEQQKPSTETAQETNSLKPF